MKNKSFTYQQKSDIAGKKMYDLIEKLYPICRSITGDGVRLTVQILRKHIPLTIVEIASGTTVFDWVIPLEWNIRDAYVKDSKGKRVIDFKKSNLHVINYSIPIKTRMNLSRLKSHIYTLPDKPDVIPYKTSYYQKDWGFCMTHNDFLKLKEGQYEVFIDSTLEKGSLTYGEYVIKGETKEEVLISTHICHPSLANDNLSGIAISTFLAKIISARKPHYTYRFLFIPGTIGSITWLSQNSSRLKNIKSGLVLTGLGDGGPLTYKRSRRGKTEIDSIAEQVLKEKDSKYQIIDFVPYGYDERQYCSPGFNLPVGTLMRKPYGKYKEYHTSADNLQFIKKDSLVGSLNILLEIISVLEDNQRYINLSPKGEPFLGKYGLYQAMNIQGKKKQQFQLALLWVLNFSDGEHSLMYIARRSGLSLDLIQQSASILTKHKLIKKSL